MHHIFDASIAVIKHLDKTIEEKVEDGYLHQAVVDSRLSALESQFIAYRTKSELEFAIQQEINDWHENQCNEKFFVMTGVPPAPTKLTGGINLNIVV